jgi:hypothetical protein
MILLLSAALPLRAQETGFDEYQVKAAFLYNFAKFVEWPQGTFATPHDPIGICIVGQSPFGLALDDTVRGKKIRRPGFRSAIGTGYTTGKAVPDHVYRSF